MKTPPFLKPGDTIGLVAPAGFMAFEKIQSCMETLNDWGYHVKAGETLYSQSATYFSGSDDQRLQDLQQLLDDPQVKAILCVRGGYGMSRIIDRLRFKTFRRHPKWIIGFSDITVLHTHLLMQYKIPSLHAPMAAAFAESPLSNPYVDSLRLALKGEKAHYHCAPHPLNRTGEAGGQLVGGNLSLLVHLLGTDSELKTKNRILFLEDVGEYLYSLDRMLVQLKRSGKLDGLAGLILGGFTDLKDTERPFGKSIAALIQEHLADYKYPVCFGFPVSHEKENYALKIGGRYRLKVGTDEVTLTEK